MNERSIAVAAAYEAIAPRVDFSHGEFAAATAHWKVYPVNLAGQCYGAVMVNGPEIHACVQAHARRRWVNRRLLGVLRDVVKHNGLAVTSATTVEGEQFVRRLGFVKEGEKWVLKPQS